MSVQYLKPSPCRDVILVLAPELVISEEEEGRRSIKHISKFFRITVEDEFRLELELGLRGSRRMTDFLRFSNRITSFVMSCVSVSFGVEGPARDWDGRSSCLMGWDGLEVDLDFANENFDVLGLRLDNLFSNSRICYPISCMSYASTTNMIGTYSIVWAFIVCW